MTRRPPTTTRCAAGRARPILAPALTTALAALAAATLLAPTPAPAAQRQERVVQRRFPARDGMVVVVENLAGRFQIEAAAGSEIEIVATVRAEGADAASLVEGLQVDFSTSGARIVVEPRYPVDRYTSYRYPDQPRGSRTTTSFQGERVRVASGAGGDGVALWVDFVLRLPPGVGADAENHVGGVSATGVRGPLSLDTGSGDVEASGNSGSLTADTGSGRVTVRDHQGDVDADTGSGNVVVESVRGNVVADTGSGSIEITDVEAERVVADTGSGHIRLQGVSGSLVADTGSGSIEARDLRARARLLADTGSGSVVLSGDLSQVDEIEIDTGSGNVTLETSPVPPMRLRIDTGNGGIDVDLPDLRILSRSRHSLSAEVGSGGVRVAISTGSGNVRVRQR